MNAPNIPRSDLPSLMRFAPTMIALLVVVISATDLADVDLWRHLKFGADMLANGGPIARDPYAYSIPHQPWISHEWLSEVIFAWIFARFGVIGLKALRLFCSAITIASLAAAVAETSAPIGIQLAVMVFASIGLIPGMQFRPQIFSYAMLSAVVWMLTRDNYRRRSSLWFAIPMLALWANLHGGFVIGLATLGIYALAAGVDDLASGHGIGRGAYLAAIVIAAALATLLTPYGIGAWRSALHTISRPPMLSHVSEWQSLFAGMAAVWHLPGLAVIFDASLVLMFGGFVLSVVLAPRGSDLPLVAVGALMLAATAAALRNIPLGIIGCAAPLARHCAVLLSARRSTHPQRHASIATQTVIGLIALALAVKMGVLSRKLETDRSYPTGALAYMAQHGLHGNILCDYEWAGYVLYHCAPGSRVFIDGRYEMIYPERIAEDFMTFYDARAGASRVLASYPHDYVLIVPDAPARKVLDASKGWKPIYSDSASALYARSSSAIAGTAKVPTTGVNPKFIFP